VTELIETDGGVGLSLSDGVAVITIDRPHVRNAIGFATVDGLHAALAEIESSDAAVVVLRGAGDRAFVSGGDLKEFGSLRTRADGVEMGSKVRDVMDRLASLPIPVIAALNGHALGGGAETAVAADIRIAADDITIGFNQVELGLMPGWGGVERLTQIVGRSRAMLAITAGERYAAADAQRLGLVDIVVPRAEFEETWRRIARRMATTAPGTTRAVKSVIAAVAPKVHPDSRDLAIDHFATLWEAPAHWAAIEARSTPKEAP
jgi:enoyl-CoA hydratase/carnithine racemase